MEKDLFDYACKMRRLLHANAEPSWQEQKTLNIVFGEAKGFDCLVLSASHCIALFFDFGKSETIAIRAELDGLPVGEKTGLSFACLSGCMHACGHDANMAVLLTLGKIFSQKKLPNKNLLLVFEPAEEDFGGAQYFLEQGFFKKTSVDTVLAVHLLPNAKKHAVLSREGVLCAGTKEVDVDFFGKSAHVATKQNGVDALGAASEFLSLAQKELECGDGFLRFCSLFAGRARNVICDKASAKGSMRYFSFDEAEKLGKKAKNLLLKVAQQRGVKVDYCDKKGIPPVFVSGEILEKAKSVWQILPMEKIFLGDDFGVLSNGLKSGYFFVGTGEGESLHSDGFDFDESVLETMVEFFLALLPKL